MSSLSFFVVVSAAIVLVEGFHVFLFMCCWLCCRGRGDGGCGPCWLLESAAYKVAFHRVPFRDIWCRGETGCVAREIAVVSVGALRGHRHEGSLT